MSKIDAGNRVKSRGPWTYVEKIKSGNKSFYVSVTYPGDPPRDVIELAGGVCAKPRCKNKPICYRQMKFEDDHRAFEFSCSMHRDIF